MEPKQKAVLFPLCKEKHKQKCRHQSQSQKQKNMKLLAMW